MSEFDDLATMAGAIGTVAAGVGKTGAVVDVARSILQGYASRRELVPEDVEEAVAVGREVAALVFVAGGAGGEKIASDAPGDDAGAPSAACGLCRAEGLSECKNDCPIKAVGSD